MFQVSSATLQQPLSSGKTALSQSVLESALSPGSSQESLSPVAHERHLDRFVRQLESFLRTQQLSDLEAVEFLSRIEKPEYPNLKLIIVHFREKSTAELIKLLLEM